MKLTAQQEAKVEQWEMTLTFLKALDKLESCLPEPGWGGAGEQNQSIFFQSPQTADKLKVLY